MRTGKQIQIFGSGTHTPLEGTLGFLENQGPALYNRSEIFQETAPDDCFFSSLQGGKNLGVGLFFFE